MLVLISAEGRGRLVRVVAAVVDAVAEQVGGNAEIFLSASKVATDQFRFCFIIYFKNIMM